MHVSKNESPLFRALSLTSKLPFHICTRNFLPSLVIVVAPLRSKKWLLLIFMYAEKGEQWAKKVKRSIFNIPLTILIWIENGEDTVTHNTYVNIYTYRVRISSVFPYMLCLWSYMHAPVCWLAGFFGSQNEFFAFRIQLVIMLLHSRLLALICSVTDGECTLHTHNLNEKKAKYAGVFNTPVQPLLWRFSLWCV